MSSVLISGGNSNGRKSHAEMNPVLVREAKRLRRRNPKISKRRSLAKILAELAKAGYLNINGQRYAAQSISYVINGCGQLAAGRALIEGAG
jgi:hypothetical protein